MAGDDNTIFVHGDVDLKIMQARSLPSMDFRGFLPTFDLCRKPSTSDSQPQQPSTSDSQPQQPSTSDSQPQHHRLSKMGTTDPYVVVYLAGIRVARTHVIPNSQNPVWNQHLKIPLAHPISQIEFRVKDNNILRSKLIGVATVPAEMIAAGELIDGWFPVIGPNGRLAKPDTAIQLKITFIPCQQNPIYASGISENYGLKESYFPWRHGGNVTLYQDAHVINGMLPEITMDEGKNFEHHKCWEDICHAISEAHHLVYILGWSVYHKVRLIREPTKSLPNGGDLNLGELLKSKSREGVRVVLLLWDDKTSHSKFFIETGGVMRTHDEETRKFFKHSSVKCLLTPRYTNTNLSNFKQQVRRAFYTQHQKCVIVDTQGNGNNRKITAFLGGLDLCDGRYDTPEHRLFRDLNTVFKDDYHNPTFRSRVRGPRQPWHDLHCKIEGPAAYDVLTNFEQRWKKASEWSETGGWFKRTSGWHDDALLDVEKISWITSPTDTTPNDHPSLWVSKEDDPENWHVQVFRSIDSGSLRGFPENVQAANEQNLVRDKKLVIDRSIEMAYIQAIRSAQHFIYIENQYFLGSSYAWPSYKNAGANNLIPMELALKIAKKIRANERFTVYIIIPMWPEGEPTSGSVQEILYWQRQTMEMMYEVVAQELKSAQLENAHPTDYLNFYCLGNREAFHEEEAGGPTSSHGNRDSTSRKFGRFMIYVHAKGMIVDDEYVILGSANINQRSMAGSRDTEIAMGAYQPHYTWNRKKEHPCGQVYGYRMSLWAEHIGSIEDCFKDPENLDCVKYINDIAETNWKRYTAEEFTPLHGHILKYPVEIDIDGRVNLLPGYEEFPDVGGEVRGSSTKKLPDKLTT